MVIKSFSDRQETGYIICNICSKSALEASLDSIHAVQGLDLVILCKECEQDYLRFREGKKQLK
jgi:hypothetical protein